MRGWYLLLVGSSLVMACGDEKTRTSASQTVSVELRDDQYLTNFYFWLDSRYRDRLGDFREANEALPKDFVPDDIIDKSSLVVYVNDFNISNDPEQLSAPSPARNSG